MSLCIQILVATMATIAAIASAIAAWKALSAMMAQAHGMSISQWAAKVLSQAN